jgi:integrase
MAPNGVRWGYLPRNPAGPGAVPMPLSPPSEIRPFESWAEVYAAAEQAGAFSSLVVFACATGLRPQEWQALEWRDVDVPGRRCHVRRTVREGRVQAAAKTDGSLRTVSLQRGALEALDALPRPLDGRLLVFPAPEGRVVNLSNFRRRVWAPALAAAGLERRPIKETRHTFATLALAAGAPVEWIAKELGHASVRTTLRFYARFLPAADARALDALDAFEDRSVRSLYAVEGRDAD